MPVHSWGDDWFRRVVPPLIATQVAVLATWGIVSMTGGAAGQPAAREAGVAASMTKPAAAAQQATAASTARRTLKPRSIVISESKGSVGRVKIGMTLPAASTALGEKLVIVQQSGPRSRRFEAVAQNAGIKLEGRGRKIDTITVTNVGAGEAFRTSRDIAVGDAMKTVPRRYAYAHKVCGREWRVQRGSKTLWFGGAKRVSSITLTSRSSPPFIDCF